MEVLSQFITRLLFKMPGAFIRWAFYYPSKSFGEILESNSIYNYFISILFMATVVFLIVFNK
jgi:hypothetical protein